MAPIIVVANYQRNGMWNDYEFGPLPSTGNMSVFKKSDAIDRNDAVAKVKNVKSMMYLAKNGLPQDYKFVSGVRAPTANKPSWVVQLSNKPLSQGGKTRRQNKHRKLKKSRKMSSKRTTRKHRKR